MVFLPELEKKFSICVEVQKTPTSQINLEREKKKNEAVGIKLPGFQLYYQDVVIMIVWYRHKNRHTDQWNRIESLEINPHIYGYLIFDKGDQDIQYNKYSLFNKWCLENCIATYERMKSEHYLRPYTKINSKCIKDLNVKPDSVKLLEENRQNTF